MITVPEGYDPYHRLKSLLREGAYIDEIQVERKNKNRKDVYVEYEEENGYYRCKLIIKLKPFSRALQKSNSSQQSLINRLFRIKSRFSFLAIQIVKSDMKSSVWKEWRTNPKAMRSTKKKEASLIVFTGCSKLAPKMSSRCHSKCHQLYLLLNNKTLCLINNQVINRNIRQFLHLVHSLFSTRFFILSLI
jgi:hypothetical protein